MNWKLWIFGLAALSSLALFQHCAEIQFTSSPSESTYEPVVDFQGNGSIYTGSVRFYVADLENICPETEHLSEIELLNGDYYLWRKDCEPIDRTPLPQSDFFQVESNKFVFDGQLYVDTEAEYEATYIAYPNSCQEIFDQGLGIENGYYYLANSTQIGAVNSTFCNIEFISQGWTPWDSWGPCSQPCGGGVQTRTRQCRVAQCAGSDIESRSCNETNCDGANP